MRKVKDAPARRLVNAAVLHADQAVLDDVGNADAVLASGLVQLPDDVRRLHLLAVERRRRAGLEVDADVFRRVRGLHRRNAHLEEPRLVVLRLVGGIFEIEALVAQVPQVLILRVIRLARDPQRHVMRLGVVDLLVAGFDVPFAPGRDDRHVRREAFDGELEADLVVAFARRAVTDCVGALRQRDLGEFLADHGTREGGAEQVLFVFRPHFQRRDDDPVHHFVDEVGHDQLGGAGFESFFLQPFQFVALSDVARNGDDLGIVVVLLQPGNDDRSVKAARVRQYDFSDVSLLHAFFLRVCVFFRYGAQTCRPERKTAARLPSFVRFAVGTATSRVAADASFRSASFLCRTWAAVCGPQVFERKLRLLCVTIP